MSGGFVQINADNFEQVSLSINANLMPAVFFAQRFSART